MDRRRVGERSGDAGEKENRRVAVGLDGRVLDRGLGAFWIEVWMRYGWEIRCVMDGSLEACCIGVGMRAGWELEACVRAGWEFGCVLDGWLDACWRGWWLFAGLAMGRGL